MRAFTRVSGALICLAFAACGDDGNSNRPADAPTGDGDIITPDTPPSAQAVTITITSGGQPQADVDVYFQNADNSLVAKATTDATGTATQVMNAGGFVTAINAWQAVRKTSHQELYTFSAVKPGDHLQLVDQDNQPGDSVNVTFNRDVDIGSQQYSVWATGTDPGFNGRPESAFAGKSDPSVNFYVLGAPTSIDVLVYADEFDGRYFFSPDNAIAGGVLTLDGTYLDPLSSTFSLSGAPDDLNSVNITNLLVTARGVVYSQNFTAEVIDGAGSLSVPRPTVPNSISVAKAEVTAPAAYGESYVVDWKPIASAQSYTYTDKRLTPLTDAPDFDVATHAAAWTEGDGAAADTSIVAISNRRNGKTEFLDWSWSVIAPHTGASVVFPVLPADAAKYNVLDTDASFFDSLTTAKTPGGYDSVRAIGLTSTLLTATATGMGQLAYQTYDNSRTFLPRTNKWMRFTSRKLRR